MSYFDVFRKSLTKFVVRFGNVIRLSSVALIYGQVGYSSCNHIKILEGYSKMKIIFLFGLMALFSLNVSAGQHLKVAESNTNWVDDKDKATEIAEKKALRSLRKKARENCNGRGYGNVSTVVYHSSRPNYSGNKTLYQATVQAYGYCND